MTIFVYPAVFGGYELPSTRIKVLSKRIAWGWVPFGEHMFGISWKWGVAPNFIIIHHHHRHHHHHPHFTKTVTQWHKLRVSPHLQLHSLLHRFGSSAVVGHGLGLATRQWRKTRGDSTHKSGERWYLRRIMKSIYIYNIHYNDYTKTMSPWKSTCFLYWFLGAGKPWISHIASGSRLLFPGFHFWDGLGNNIGKSKDMWKCMQMYLSNKQCCIYIYT